MEGFTLTYIEDRPPLGDQRGGMVFQVERGDIRFPIYLAASGTLVATWGLWGPEHEARLRQEILLRGLPRIMAELRQMEVPASSTDMFYKVLLHTEGIPMIHLPAFPDKECSYQKTAPGGLLCDVVASDDPDKGRTTKAICQSCNLPDDRVRCSKLVHPQVRSVYDETRAHLRAVTDAMCEEGRRCFNPAHPGQCVPGGHPCWVQIKEPVRVGEVPSDTAERLVDEIDHFVLAFRDRFGHKPLNLAMLSSVKVILGSVETEKDFVFVVAALADILNQIRVEPLLMPEENRLDGSLNKLEAFLRRKGVLLAGESLGGLKIIPRLRSIFPIHSRTHGVAAILAELRIEFPVMDFRAAWLRVAGHVVGELRLLRVRLHDGDAEK